MNRSLVLALLLSLAACASGGDDPFLALAKRCDASPGASNCAAAGDYLWENNGKKLQPCKSPQAVACRRAGEESADAVQRLDKLALEYHDRACLFGDGNACNKAGVALAVQYSVAPEPQAPDLAREAEARFQKACKLGSKEGCRNVGSTKAAQ